MSFMFKWQNNGEILFFAIKPAFDNVFSLAMARNGAIDVLTRKDMETAPLHDPGCNSFV